MSGSSYQDKKKLRTSRELAKHPRKFRKPRPARSIRLDRVNPSDFRKLDFIYACEQCSFFDASKTHCTMGYNPPQHLQARQLELYNLTGRMAFCRFQEID